MSEETTQTPAQVSEDKFTNETDKKSIAIRSKAAVIAAGAFIIGLFTGLFKFFFSLNNKQKLSFVVILLAFSVIFFFIGRSIGYNDSESYYEQELGLDADTITEFADVIEKIRNNQPISEDEISL